MCLATSRCQAQAQQATNQAAIRPTTHLATQCSPVKTANRTPAGLNLRAGAASRAAVSSTWPCSPPLLLNTHMWHLRFAPVLSLMPHARHGWPASGRRCTGKTSSLVLPNACPTCRHAIRHPSSSSSTAFQSCLTRKQRAPPALPFPLSAHELTRLSRVAKSYIMTAAQRYYPDTRYPKTAAAFQHAVNTHQHTHQHARPQRPQLPIPTRSARSPRPSLHLPMH